MLWTGVLSLQYYFWVQCAGFSCFHPRSSAIGGADGVMQSLFLFVPFTISTFRLFIISSSSHWPNNFTILYGESSAQPANTVDSCIVSICGSSGVRELLVD
jgi:hypothetical protein